MKNKIKDIKSITLDKENKEKLINEFFLSKNKHIQKEIIKKLSSVEDSNLCIFFDEIVLGDYPSYVQKEAVSALGRMRNYEVAYNYLFNYLNNRNPEIVLQAIRGLLVFKDYKDIKEKLFDIYETNPNEIIKYIISKEFHLELLDFDTKKSHIEVNENYKNKVINGDVLSILKNVDNNSVHLTFTSPPYYNARDYSIYSSYEEYIEFLSQVFEEVHRVTKDGRFLIINTSPVIIPRVGRKYSSKRYPIAFDLHNKLVNNGWEFIDDIYWVKPDASVKNRVGGFTQHRKALMYKPNSVTEQIMVYRKKSNKLIDWNLNCYPKDVIESSKVLDTFDRTNIWYIDPVHDKKHSAVFPYELCKKIVEYYSLKGDLIFDPFAGSGTLGRAALDYERNIFMTEIQNDYFERIKEKMKLYFGIEFLNEDEFTNKRRDMK